MKRWIFLLALVPALGVMAPIAAQASTVSGGPLTSGKPVKATISKAGTKIQYTFAATAHKHVTFQVTNFNFSDNGSGGDLYLNFYEPGSSSTFNSCYFSDNGYCDFTTPIGGTWKAVVAPPDASVGSMTLTFANDVATQPLTSGTPVATTIKFEGQNANYTFPATANARITFQVTNFNFSDNGSGGDLYLNFFEPGSSAVHTDCYFSDNGYCDFTPPLTGTWSATLDPPDASTGNLTLTFANDVATKALTTGVPVATTIRFQGQNANYTFPAKVNTGITFHITKFNLSDNGSGGDAYLNFFEPGSSAVYTSCYFSSNGSCTIKPPVGGTWKATLDPPDASTGSLTLTMG